MPESGLDQPLVKELTDDLQGINGFLLGLRRKTIHQIGMHQDSGVDEIVGRPEQPGES